MLYNFVKEKQVKNSDIRAKTQALARLLDSYIETKRTIALVRRKLQCVQIMKRKKFKHFCYKSLNKDWSITWNTV